MQDRELVLQAAARRPLTSRWVADALAISVNEARELLRSMVEEGVLRRVGQTKGTHYVLPDWTEGRTSATASFAFDAHQREVVLRAAQGQRLTNERVRHLLHATAAQAFAVLSQLVEEGVLERRGQRRGTHYVLTPERKVEGGSVHLPERPTLPRIDQP